MRTCKGCEIQALALCSQAKDDIKFVIQRRREKPLEKDLQDNYLSTLEADLLTHAAQNLQ